MKYALVSILLAVALLGCQGNGSSSTEAAPATAEEAYQIALGHYKAQNWEAAAKSFEQAVELDSAYYPASTMLAEIQLERLFNYQAVITHCNQAILLHDNLPEGAQPRDYKMRAQAYVEIGEYERAMRDYEDYINMERDSKIVLEVGNLALVLGRMQLACEWWNKALALGEQDARDLMEANCN